MCKSRDTIPLTKDGNEKQNNMAQIRVRNIAERYRGNSANLLGFTTGKRRGDCLFFI
jgi:hypothetical protein